MSQAVVITVLALKNNKRELCVSNKIMKVFSFETFREILLNVYETGKDAAEIEVRVSSSMERKEEAEIDPDETISLANEIFNVKTVKYVLTFKSEPVENTAQLPTVTDVLMKRKQKQNLKILKSLPEKDKKIALHNELLRDIQQQPFLAAQSQDEGHKLLKILSNALWYLDGRSETINEAARKRKTVNEIPKR